MRRTLDKELTRAILDGRLNEGDRVVAGHDGEGGIALVVREPAAQPLAAWRGP